ncbi:MAG: efflux RND transporter periplasmic adaptor subunit, partial [Anaerolineae bacterium]|nr:efflux RND transporter periplasmic adaptor subunit [Anaerolineae bacterium]
KSSRSSVTRRRLKWVGIVILVVVLVVGGIQLATSVGNSLKSTFTGGHVTRGGVGQVEQVPVKRGTVTDAVIAFGRVAPMRVESLAFRKASERIVSVNAETGMPVTKGQVLVELDMAALERDLATARGDLQEAQQALDDLSASDSTLEYALQVDLSRAQATLEAATRALKAFDEGKDTPEERRAQAADELASARADLEALREDRSYQKEIDRLQWLYNQAEVEHGPYVLIENPSEQDRDTEWLLRNEMLARGQTQESARLAHEAQLRDAERRVVEEQRSLDRLGQEIALGNQAVERAKLEAAESLAQAKIMEIEERLASLDEGTDTVDLAKAQALVLKLEGQVRDAEAALAEGRLVSPFDGTVLEVRAVPEAMALPGAEMLTVADYSAFQVVANVSELDVLKIKAGQEVTLTFDALDPETRLTGRLGEIPNYGRYEGGITYYQVNVTFDAGELSLKDGFAANISIPVGHKENVLVIPAAAIWEGREGSFVNVVEGDEVNDRQIKTGVGDGVTVEVLEGLEEGEIVYVQLRPPQSRGMYPGGMY